MACTACSYLLERPWVPQTVGKKIYLFKYMTLTDGSSGSTRIGYSFMFADLNTVYHDHILGDDLLIKNKALNPMMEASEETIERLLQQHIVQNKGEIAVEEKGGHKLKVSLTTSLGGCKFLWMFDLEETKEDMATHLVRPLMAMVSSLQTSCEGKGKSIDDVKVKPLDEELFFSDKSLSKLYSRAAAATSDTLTGAAPRLEVEKRKSPVKVPQLSAKELEAERREKLKKIESASTNKPKKKKTINF